MKKIGIIIVLALVAFVGTQSCIAQSKVFKEAASIEGVTSIYISPLLLKLGTTPAELGHGLDDAVKEISAFEVITAEENCKNLPKVAESCRKIIAGMGCEVLMDVNEDNDKVKIYASVPKGGTYADKLIIEVDEGKEYTVVYVKGKIDLEKVMKD